MASDPESNEIKAVTKYVRVNEDGDEVEKADTTDSYRYGSEKIPVLGEFFFTQCFLSCPYSGIVIPPHLVIRCPCLQKVN